MTSPSERDLDRHAHPAPCATNPDGSRQYTPPPAAGDIVRNFGAQDGGIPRLPAATVPAKP